MTAGHDGAASGPKPRVAPDIPDRREPPLFAEFPELARAVPWRPLAHAPTPVAPCETPWLGREGVWHKRDDLVSPIFGGNKIRRFEYLLADAERRGARRLVTVGGLASTQVVATSLLAQRLGLGVTAVLFDQPVTSFGKKAILTAASAGAELVYGGSYLVTTLNTVNAYRRAEHPYLILPGASSPMANLGYVDAMLELGEQVRRGEAPRPDVIVVPAGSGGTLAGLAVGAAILRWPTKIVGVRITERIACNRVTIRLLIEATARFLQRRAGRATRRPLGGARFALHQGAIGRGYGYPTPDAIAAIPEVLRLIGVPGEVTYSGKGLAGLRAILREHPRQTVLYWHTLSSTWPAVDPASMPAAFAPLFQGSPTV